MRPPPAPPKKRKENPYLAGMKWLPLIVLPVWVQAQKALPLGEAGRGLKPGIYHNLKPTQPLVLDTGSYTFIDLEMSCIVPPLGAMGLVLLDARKAHRLTLVNCHFEGVGESIGVLASAITLVEGCAFYGLQTSLKVEAINCDLNVSRSVFSGLNQNRHGSRGIYCRSATGTTSILNNTFTHQDRAVQYEGTSATTNTGYNVQQNVFQNNTNAILLDATAPQTGAQFGITLKCNKFEVNGTIPSTENWIGLQVGSKLKMSTIGGNGVGTNAKPNANRWPVDHSNNTTTSPFPPTSAGGGIDWTGPPNWTSIYNHSESEWSYYRYKNEFVGNASDGSVNQQFTILEANRLVRSCINPNGTYCQINHTIGTLDPLDMDDACPNFGSVVVFPTRQAVVQDSGTTRIQEKKSSKGYLGQNIPNPASQSTTIDYELPAGARDGKIEVFDLATGRIVKTVGIATAGRGQVTLGLHAFPAGIFGYRLVSGGIPVDWKKMIITH